MKYLCSILLSLFTFSLYAQLQRNYSSYTVDNGLAQNTVWDAFQDYRGYMWFGTADGLNRFDGYKMNHYKWNIKDSSTLRGNTNFKFYEDSRNRLWISHNKGVSIYNRQLDCFKNVLFETPIKNGNGESYATILSEDQKGRMWSVSGNQELIAIDMNTLQEIKRINVTSSRYQVSSIRTSVTMGNYIFCYLNDSNTTWFRVNTRTDKIDIINGPSAFSGFFIKYNDSTICALNKENVYYYNVNQSTFKIIPIKQNAITKKLNFLSSTSMVIWQGKIWMGNNTGLYVFNPKKNEFEERITSFNKVEKIGFYYVQFLRVDRSNNLWICTNGDGAKCLSPYSNKFKHYANSQSQTKLVKSITSDAEQNIYAGMYAEGIVTYKNDGTSEQYKFGKQNDEHAHILAQAYWNKRYFVVHDRYLKELHPTTKKELTQTDVFHYRSLGYCAYPFFHSYNNKLYLSCDLAFYEVEESGKGKSIYKFSNFDTVVTCFTIINDTTWWVGTTKFICEFNPLSKKWKKLPLNIYTKTLCLSNDKRVVWVGAAVGLYLMNISGKVLEKFEIAEGLPDDFIYGILEDNRGRFWMSHNKGISVYNPLSKTFKNYTVKDGLQSNEFNTGAYYRDDNGLLYFGGVNGINVIDPDNINENKNIPQIGANEILVDDLPYSNDTAYNEIHTINLSYLQNTLSFDFSALEFSQPEDNTYRYKMEGYDNNWIESGTKHFARYANLPPGNYIFKIKAANGDGFWNENPREIYINVRPPYWQTGWFYALIGALILIALAFVVFAFINRQKARLRRELEVQQKLEEERLRISRDLHDNVGAQLSYLITNVEWMLQHPNRLNEKDEQHRLKEMSEAGRNAILTLRQTIWAISQTSLTIEDFADRFKQFALKMVAFNKQIQVQFKENFEINSTVSPAVALHLFRICQEAFNNSLKHSQATIIVISFDSSEQTTFGYTVADNGIGFDWEDAKRKGHYGLINMQARARECNAQLILNSEPGKGTSVTITLK